MRSIFLTLSIFTVALFGAANANAQHGASKAVMEAVATSAIGTVVTVGPDGKVYMWFKDGDLIKLKICQEKKPIKSKADCVGPERSMPVDALKLAIENKVKIGPADALKPLTQDDIDNLKKGGNPDIAGMEQRKKELEGKIQEIKDFISWAGENNAGAADKAKQKQLETDLVKAEQDLVAGKHQSAAISRVNEQIDKVVTMVTDEKINVLKHDTNKDDLVFNVLSTFDPKTKIPCGKTGTVEERVAHCAKLGDLSKKKTSKGKTFTLVSRTDVGKEVWRDDSTGLVWGDTLDERMSYYDAQKACGTVKSKDSTGNILGKNWGLPSKEDFETAEANGIREVNPSSWKDRYFWSSSVGSGFYVGYACYFSGDGGEAGYDYRYNTYSVRCVGRSLGGNFII